MNPIIETVEVGHVNHGDRCVLCKVKWPCPPILQARIHNRTYVPVPVDADGPREPSKAEL